MARREIPLPGSFDGLRDQIIAAAEGFSGDSQKLGEILLGLISDTERACREPLELFPVCHHSPASAIHLLRRLRDRPPRLILMEGCEDLLPALNGLSNCKLPVALQAFAPKPSGFPEKWSPLNLVMPLTEFSAEFQAIAYTFANPKKATLRFVDRSADLVFQWMPDDDLEAAIPPDPPQDGEADEQDEAAMHGAAVGVEVGSLVPTFQAFTELLLKNARVQHYSEWWDQYVEAPIIGADYGTYRQAMFLIGSLIARLGRKERDRESDLKRERHMWTRIKEILRETGVDPADAIHICGAAHTATTAPEFGIENDTTWEIPPRSDTQWLYGILPSSYAAIEHQFAHARGALSLAEAAWRKNLRSQGLKAWSLKQTEKKKKKKEEVESPEEPEETVVPVKSTGESSLSVLEYLQQPPPTLEDDHGELIRWSVSIVALARKHGYLASTADSIAIYHTSILLANMRNRLSPSAWDFRDAAITCLEKDRTPKRRDIRRICDILLGGDRVGQIGYDSLPPLAQNVYDRLSLLPINLEAKTIQRALLDYKKNPEFLACSELLWKLRYLIGDVVRPIMGELALGSKPLQESWDIAIGKNQGALIQLGYEGITIEGVLERRLKQDAFKNEATAVDALQATENCILLLKSERLADELGARATELLVNEDGVGNSHEIYQRISRLVQYYRGEPGGMADWCGAFVRAGYSHYTTLLPTAFSDRGVTPSQIASMLAFIFTLESLALSMGCQRSELLIAIQQAAPNTVDPAKKGLLWTAELVLQLRTQAIIRDYFQHLLQNETALPVLPDYLSGFLLALSFTPLVNKLTVELLSRVFGELPDRLLMPWIPKLVMMLRPHAGTALPSLIQEAGRLYPNSLAALTKWLPPWMIASTGPATPAPAQPVQSTQAASVHRLLEENPEAMNWWKNQLEINGDWSDGEAAATDDNVLNPAATKCQGLLLEFPEALEFWAKVRGSK